MPRRRGHLRSVLYLIVVCFQLIVVSYLQTHQLMHHDTFKHNVREVGKSSTEAPGSPPTLGGIATPRRTDETQNGQRPTRTHGPRRALSESFHMTQVQLNTRRRQMLNAYCDKHPELLDGPLNKGTLRHILVSDHSKLMYCYIPSAGSNFWKGAMMVLDADNHKERERSSESQEVNFQYGLRSLGSYSSRQRQHRIETYTKLIFVRHPFTRIFLSFKHVLNSHVPPRNDRHRDLIARKIKHIHATNSSASDVEAMLENDPVTWKEFAHFLAEDVVRTGGDHFEDIHRLCDPCKIQYDYIGKLETEERDSQFMLKELNVGGIVTYPSRDRRHSTNSSSASGTYLREFTTLSHEVLGKLWNMYAHDFGLFDYMQPNVIVKG